MLALVAVALAAPCPPPSVPASAATVTADGAAHLLARDASATCWWIVDDAGDARVAARWDRRDAVALTADGRAVVVLRESGEPGRWRLAVRTEGGRDRVLGVELPSPPARLFAHGARPLVALVWPAADVVWIVDVDAGRVVATAPVLEAGAAAARVGFAVDAAITPGWDDARR